MKRARNVFQVSGWTAEHDRQLTAILQFAIDYPTLKEPTVKHHQRGISASDIMRALVMREYERISRLTDND